MRLENKTKTQQKPTKMGIPACVQPCAKVIGQHVMPMVATQQKETVSGRL